MSTQFNPDEIARLLVRNTQQMDETTLSALRRARKIALERQKQPVHAPALAFAHTPFQRLVPHSTAQWWAAALFAATLTGIASYYHHSRDQQISELDVAILTDELPLEVFVD